MSARNPYLTYLALGPGEEPCYSECVMCRGGTSYSAYTYRAKPLTEDQLDLFVKTGRSVWLDSG